MQSHRRRAILYRTTYAMHATWLSRLYSVNSRWRRRLRVHVSGLTNTMANTRRYFFHSNRSFFFFFFSLLAVKLNTDCCWYKEYTYTYFSAWRDTAQTAAAESSRVFSESFRTSSLQRIVIVIINGTKDRAGRARTGANEVKRFMHKYTNVDSV